MIYLVAPVVAVAVRAARTQPLRKGLFPRSARATDKCWAGWLADWMDASGTGEPLISALSLSGIIYFIPSSELSQESSFHIYLFYSFFSLNIFMIVNVSS